MKKQFFFLPILALVVLFASCDVSILADLIYTESAEAATEQFERTEHEKPSESVEPAESTKPMESTESAKQPADTTEPEQSEEVVSATESEGSSEKTESSTHEHSFGEWTVVQEPTTTETGLRERVCACGESETETIPVVDSGLVFKFSEEHNGYFVTGKGTNRDVDLVIPGKYNGYPVVGIGYQAFYMNVYAKTVTIPDSVKYIEEEAFIYAEMIESIYMTDSVVEIGYGAFSNNLSLKNVRLSDSLEEVPARLFKESRRLEEVNIPKSAKSIGEQAFYECEALKSIVLPQGVMVIGAYAFYECKNISSDVIIPNGVEEISGYAFYSCENVKKAVISANVKILGDYAFGRCSSLERVILEEGSELESIGNYAFTDCLKLEILNFENALSTEAKIVFSSTVTSIGDGAFINCPIDGAIIIPASVKDIGKRAFWGTRITNVHFAVSEGWKRWEVIYQGVPAIFAPVSKEEISNSALMAEKLTQTDTRAMRLFAE